MFRFTIRELALVTLVVGLALGWSVDRWGLCGQIKTLEDDVHTTNMAITRGGCHFTSDANGRTIVAPRRPSESR
jgi:hypothetical protein